MGNPDITAQPVVSLQGHGVLYHELFCGVASSDWNAADDCIISDARALERLLDAREDINKLRKAGHVFGVNVGFISAACNGASFLHELARTIRSGIIEITEHGEESMTADNVAMLVGFCAKARSMGFRIVLDDVSMGYPLLQHETLRQIRPYAIKSIVTQSDLPLVASIARDNDIALVIENVENEHHEQIARAHGNAAQGYRFGRPTQLNGLTT